MIHKFRLALPFLVLFIVAVSGCAHKEVIVPRLTPESAGEKLTGKFVWYDLFTHDLKSASTFYQGLFGWTFTETDPSFTRVKTINRDGLPIANAVEIDPLKEESNESIWLGYISVPDVDKAAEQVKLHQGAIYRKPKDLPNRGRIAIVFDGEGAIFGLVHSSEGDPPDLEDIKNSFIGSELWTTDLNRAIAFYTALVGYELKIIDVAQDKKYHLLQYDNIPRAGVAKILWDDVKPNWIPYIAVKDILETIDKAEALGGRLLIRPPKEPGDNPLAILADPSGAVFGIQQIGDSETTGGNRP